MKVAILTNFGEFHSGYSLTGIVKDQCRMLIEHGHEVHLFVNEQYNDKYDGDMPEGVTVRQEVPFAHLIDYTTQAAITPDHKETIDRTSIMLCRELADFDMAWTHDWLLTGWFLPYGIAAKRSTLALPNLRWLHWIHSMPCAGRDWWRIKDFGSRHKLVGFTASDRQRIAEAYHGAQKDIRIIPHIKDLRSWYDFGEDACQFIRDFPLVMHADVSQIYPASADRLNAKQLDKVIRIFGNIKARGASVFLACADQWATGRQRKEDEKQYIDLAHACGLTDDEFTFTSDWAEAKYATGIPKRMLRELQLCSNLFIFPTIQESFGLVGPEAALAGLFVVTNQSLRNQGEIFEHQALDFCFGSYEINHAPPSWEDYLNNIAGATLQRMSENDTIRTRTVIRKKLNYDSLYNRVYEPIMCESKLWAGKVTVSA